MAKIRKPKRKREVTFIKAWRDFRGLTQERAAERIGISRENYGRIESGKVPYNQDFLEIAAVAFDCSTTDLLERNPIIESMADKLRRIVSKANEADQKRILAIAETLIENKG